MPNLSPVPTTKDMWNAYLFAPAVTPLSFMVLTQAFGISLPAAAVVGGFCASYVVAGVLGMPIAIVLRRVGQLNALTIHGAAFAWSVLWSILCMIAGVYTIVAIDGSISSLPLFAATISGLMVPPVVLAGTVFWGLLKRPQIFRS